MLSFNLFQSLKSPDLFCAVPEDRAVPDFIAAEGWAFGGKLGSDLPLGFNPQAAETSAHFNGFYLFQRV